MNLQNVGNILGGYIRDILDIYSYTSARYYDIMRKIMDNCCFSLTANNESSTI